MRTILGYLILGCAAVSAQTFAVASIRPSAAEVQFEHDGKTVTTPGTVTMRDVTVATCIKWAYGVQDSQIAGPKWLQSEHFDITARADGPADPGELRKMMQALPADTNCGPRLRARRLRANSAIGMVVARRHDTGVCGLYRGALNHRCSN